MNEARTLFEIVADVMRSATPPARPVELPDRQPCPRCGYCGCMCGTRFYEQYRQDMGAADIPCEDSSEAEPEYPDPDNEEHHPCRKCGQLATCETWDEVWLCDRHFDARKGNA